jgi:hypothetical protein
MIDIRFEFESLEEMKRLHQLLDSLTYENVYHSDGALLTYLTTDSYHFEFQWEYEDLEKVIVHRNGEDHES